MDWIEGIGLLAGFLGVFGWYPQVRRVWVDKRADGVSVSTFTVIAISLALWYIEKFNCNYYCKYFCFNYDN